MELVIATHAHEDHIGGVPEVFDDFRVERYIDSGTVVKTKIYERVAATVAAEGCKASGDENEVIQYKELTVQIIETGDNHSNINNDSIIALVTHGDVKMLFTGDAESEIEATLSGVGKVHLFKAAHHGSDTSNSVALLSVIRPDVTVISYGVGNSYGHPHKGAYNRLSQYSGAVYYTGGKSVVITSDGHGLRLN